MTFFGCHIFIVVFLVQFSKVALQNDEYLKSLVSIRVNQCRGKDHICGGVIIGSNRVLTAAHCCYTPKNLRKKKSVKLAFITGIQKRFEPVAAAKVYNVKRMIVHPNYKYGKFNDDIAVLISFRDIALDDGHVAIMPLIEERPLVGTVCQTLGWGRVFEAGPLLNDVMYGSMRLWPNEICAMHTLDFSAGIICTEENQSPGRDICVGDSGGPLVCNGTLTGIISFGMGCGVHRMPIFYSNVWYYRDWIINHSGAVQSRAWRFKIMSLTFIIVGILLGLQKVLNCL